MRVAMSDWWASRIEVSVMSRRFCSRIQRQNFSGPSSAGDRASPLQRRGDRIRGSRGAGIGLSGCPAFGGGVAVDGDVGEVVQQLGGAVACGLELEQLGIGVDEAVVAWPLRKVSCGRRS
jgi:hypothetical protein